MGAKRTGKYLLMKDPDETKRPCIQCHKRRIKCNLERPKCSKCSKKGLECLYKTDKSSNRKLRLHKDILGTKAVDLIQRQDRLTRCNPNEASKPTEIQVISHSPFPVNEASKIKDVMGKQDSGKPDAQPDKNGFLNGLLLDAQSPNNMCKKALGALHNLEVPQTNYGERGQVDIIFPREAEVTKSHQNFELNENECKNLMKTAKSLQGWIDSDQDISVSDICKLADYFVEFVLDQMVPFDSNGSPYRVQLVPRITTSVELLATVVSISAGHIQEKGENHKYKARALHEASSNFSDQSYLRLLERLNSRGKTSLSEETLGECLLLLLQSSKAVFASENSDAKFYYKIQDYIGAVKVFSSAQKELQDEFEFLVIKDNGLKLFLLQRLIFLDVFASCLNNTDIVVDTDLVKFVVKFESTHIFGRSFNPSSPVNTNWSTLIEITGCPVELLQLMHEIQKESSALQKLVEVEKRHPSDMLKIFINKRRLSLENKFKEEIGNYTEDYKEKLLVSEWIDGGQIYDFINLSKIFLFATNILLFRRIGNKPRSSPEIICNVDNMLNVISESINVGSGPDSCVAFPVFTAARYSVLKLHRGLASNFMDLSCWHLKLGAQRVAKRLLLDRYWCDNDEKDIDVPKKYLIIY